MDEKYNLPWIYDFLENQFAQGIEDYKYPEGHLLKEVTITASGRPEDKMRANLQSSIERRLLKDAKDTYTLLRNMNQALTNFAQNVGLPLMFMPAAPLATLGWSISSPAFHGAALAIDKKVGGHTVDNIVSGTELGLMALGAGAGTYAGGRALLNNTNWGKAYQLSRAIGRGNVRETPNFGNNELFRATVYRGGPIKYPRQLWVSTDPKYVAQYGPVRKYLFETRNPSYAELPLMGARDPVSMDMMIYTHTRNNPQALAIIGHDLVTGEFPYLSEGLEILSLNPYLFRGFRPKSKYVYPWQQPSRNTLTEAERLGIPKGERNFKPRWHVANYPGYLLKGLMKGSLLEKQLSKNGTININLLNAYFNKASQIEKEVANKVLAEQFAGLKTIDYNLFKKAVLDELIGSYNRVPLTEWADYGVESLGYNLKTVGENELPGLPNLIILGLPVHYIPPGTKADPINLSTFTFESPRIPYGNTKHYRGNPIGHSRTYTTPDEPNILHVMESLSDWAQAKKGLNQLDPDYYENDLQNVYNRIFSEVEKSQQELNLAKRNLEKGLYINGNIIPESDMEIASNVVSTLEKELSSKQSKLSNLDMVLHPEKYVLENYLKLNYLLRQLQENLRYAAENGLTKMRYPTRESAVKIEGYTPAKQPSLRELSDAVVQELKSSANAPTPYSLELFNLRQKLLKLTDLKEINRINSLINRIKKIEDRWKSGETTYPSDHETILDKYSDFPKLFLKLFKDLQVRTVTDAKGNTWYEVDVPKGYLNREWLFKKGGKMNIIEKFKEVYDKYSDKSGNIIDQESFIKESKPPIRSKFNGSEESLSDWFYNKGNTASTFDNIKNNLKAYFLKKSPNYPISKYKPTKGNPNITYYSIPNLKYDVARNISKKYLTGEPLKTFEDVYNDNKFGNSREMGAINLGRYYVSTGKDKRGKYISYYDKYDWNLLELLGIGGLPFEIYDRIYEDEWPVYSNNLDAITYKLGGKMNIIEFLKNGSGIHIKKANRGKFTEYCGGKVTSECIAKGKNSSDPAVRKRATFALNARHFKHRSGGLIVQEFKLKRGGKAFVAGVSVLDSNPNIYKHEKKKKLKKAQQGSKIDWGTAASAMALFGTSALNMYLLSKNATTAKEALKALKEAMINSSVDDSNVDILTQNYIEHLKLIDPNINIGNITFKNIRNMFASQARNKAKNDAENWYKQLVLNIDLNLDLAVQLFGNSIGSSFGTLVSAFGLNKPNNSSVNAAPSSNFTTNVSLYKNNSMFSPLNYSNPNYVNNFFNKS